MKLSSAQIEQTLHQMDAETIPSDHPLVPQLVQLFGDHTYFLDRRGLNIVEPVEPSQSNGRLGVVLNLADWTDAEEPKLRAHEPESTDIVIALGLDGR